MHDEISAVANDLTEVARRLTEAVGFKELSEEMDVSLGELVTILSSNWNDSVYVQKLSEDAFYNLLASTKGDGEEEDDCLSFDEYLRFRQVIRWWIFKHCYTAAEELVDFVTLDENSARFVYRSGVFEEVERPVDDVTRLSNLWSSIALDEDQALRNCVLRLLSNVDFRKIHPTILARVVEPLDILPSAEMLTAFRFHALRKPTNLPRMAGDWGHHSTCNAYVVRKSSSTVGFAVLPAPMSADGIYEWQFIVEKVPSKFFQLGFIDARVLVDLAVLEDLVVEPGDFEGKLSDQHLARMLDFSGRKARINSCARGGSPDSWGLIEGFSLRKGSRVTFTFDAREQFCSFYVENRDCTEYEDFEESWGDIPTSTYYPAVSLGESGEGCVRIELTSGFDNFGTFSF